MFWQGRILSYLADVIVIEQDLVTEVVRAKRGLYKSLLKMRMSLEGSGKSRNSRHATTISSLRL